jgi:hypothetical protein
MGLDEVHGPPAVGTEGWLDPYVSDAMAVDRSDVCGDRARLAACFAVTDDESPDLAVINACYAVTEGRDSTSNNEPALNSDAANPTTSDPKRSWTSIKKARDDPMWDTHIRPAIRKEIDKIFDHYKTIRVVPWKEYLECVQNHPERTVLLDCLMPITAKYNVDGEFTKVKPRIVVADKRATCQMANVYAPSVQMDTVNLECTPTP